MADPYFFGYGSLVNRTTHDFPMPRRATLKGWRRAWRHTDLRPVAFLTAIPDSDGEIDGLIAHVPDDDWDALDQREWAYDRIPVTDRVTHPLSQDIEVAVYAVPEDRHSAPTDKHPIMLSYLDVVLQGYLHEFGEDGVRRFLSTTDGWDAPVLNDRAAPKYPRHRLLSAGEIAFVDECLQSVAARISDTTS